MSFVIDTNPMKIISPKGIKYSHNNYVNRTELRKFLNEVSKSYPNFDNWFNFTFLHGIEIGTRHIIMAHKGDSIIGISLLKNDLLEKKICTFYIDPSFRGKNIGNSLMDLSIRSLGYNNIIVTVSEDRNFELYPLLTNKKFYLKESINGLYDPDKTELIYRRNEWKL